MNFKKILKNPIHEARKLRLDLHRTGKVFKNMAKDPTATTGEKLKNYTYGSMTHGLRNAVKYGTKAAEAGTNKFKDAYNSSDYVKPIIQGQLNVKREVGNIVKNNPVKTTLGGLVTLEGGRRLLKDDEDDKDSQSLTTNLSESENFHQLSALDYSEVINIFDKSAEDYTNFESFKKLFQSKAFSTVGHFKLRNSILTEKQLFDLQKLNKVQFLNIMTKGGRYVSHLMQERNEKNNGR